MSAGTIILAGGGTGGHVYPLVAVAEALQALAPNLPLMFVGTERGIESRVVPQRGYQLQFVRVAPLRGGGVAGWVRGAARAVVATAESRALVRRMSPAAVLSIGGYAAGPVSLAARWLGVPLALIEPNAVTGLANRLLAPFVQRAYTAFAGAEPSFKQGTILRAGVPLRAGFGAQPFRAHAGPVRVLVLGGSQGARSLNEAVPEALARLPLPAEVVHQCGAAHEQAVRARYREQQQLGRVEVVGFINDMPAALAAADLVVSRAGASAVSEICSVGRPSILVPYPYAAGDHQRRNAESLQRGGAAVCVPASEATATRLASELQRLVTAEGRLAAMAERARQIGRPDAAMVIATDLLALAGLRLRDRSDARRSVAEGSGPGPGPVALREAV